MSVQRVGIIGGGFIGYLTALWIKKMNADISLSIIERQREVGGREGASYGCAGSFAPYGCVPINSPSILKRFPQLLGISDSRTKPLSIQWKQAIKMRKWLISFLRNCTPGQVDKITYSLGKLTQNAYKYYEPFLSEIENQNSESYLDYLLSPVSGCIYLYESINARDAVSFQSTQRKTHGVSITELSIEETLVLEGAIDPSHFGCSQFLTPSRYTTNPSLLLHSFHNMLKKCPQSRVIHDNVSAIDCTQNHSVIVHGKQEEYHFDQLVICGGIYSKEIMHMIGDYSVPLDTERGYHIMLEYSKDQILQGVPQNAGLRHIVGFPQKGVYLTPMNNGIRVAGLVEIGGGTQLPPSEEHFDYLRQVAKELFLPASEMILTSKWMGFRPTLPDSLPVIGSSSVDPRIIYNFGHQHIGMTLAGVSGFLSANVLFHNDQPFDINPYSPTRFL